MNAAPTRSRGRPTPLRDGAACYLASVSPRLRHALAIVALGVLATGGAWLLDQSATPARSASAPPAQPPRAEESLEDFLAELSADEGELGRDGVAIVDPSGHALDAFHEALRRVERAEGIARIAVYGGSHTAGDFYTGRMRELLQSRYGDAGHGFTPLVPVVRNAWAWGVVIDDAEGFEAMQVGFKRREVFRYGLAGTAFLADEAEAFAAVTSAPWGNSRWASHVELLYDRLPNAGSMEVWLDGQRVDTLETAVDPAEPGVEAYDVSDATHRLEVRAVGDGPVTVYGVVMEREGPGVIVDNLGLVGSKARHQLLWDEDLRRFFLQRRSPDLVIFAYGNNETNDSYLEVEDHERHLREALARIERAAPDADCVLVGPTDRPRLREDGELERWPIVAALTEMQRRVAADLGCGFFDTLAFQGGLGAGIEWLEHDPPYMRDDRQHLTRPGYLRWGEVLTRSLLEGMVEP